ncbi:hypothetical protein VNO77_11023 [Canavalia gladiata]|uniref:Transmembrane protein n=1 Tax=Canavalia gladiata TaxID=3824 RepID=A0AAN9MGF3_CANGL
MVYDPYNFSPSIGSLLGFILILLFYWNNLLHAHPGRDEVEREMSGSTIGLFKINSMNNTGRRALHLRRKEKAVHKVILCGIFLICQGASSSASSAYSCRFSML